MSRFQKMGQLSGQKRQTPKIQANKAEAIRLHVEQDLSVNQIGFRLGISQATIRKWLIAAGVYKCGHRKCDGKTRLDGTIRAGIVKYDENLAIALELEKERKMASKLDDFWARHPIAIQFNRYYRNHAHHKAKAAAAMRLRYHAGKVNRLKGLLSARIYKAMRRGGHGKKAFKTMELIGCSILELRTHLENTFSDGMTWQNYGRWHIDHKRPCNSFNLSNKDEQLTCFNWRNLQAKWAADNISKGDKWEGNPQGWRSTAI